MSQPIANLLSYLFRLVGFFAELISKLFAISKSTEQSSESGTDAA